MSDGEADEWAGGCRQAGAEDAYDDGCYGPGALQATS
jgi:hypothetical protein